MPIKGFKHSEETKKKISKSLMGRKLSGATRKKMSESKKHMSDETKRKIGLMFRGKKLSTEHRKKLSRASKLAISNSGLRKRISDSLNKRWDKIGRKPKRIFERPRNSKYYNWRRGVFERDNYTCQECSIKSGNGKAVYLEAHHIKSWVKYKKLRFNINNGITLCRKCHKLKHKNRR